MVSVDSKVILMPSVLLVVHPIDRKKHPSWPEGYRWAVHVGGQPVHDLRFCVNAGYQRQQQEAVLFGDVCAAAVTQAMRVFGMPAALRHLILSDDPLPAGDRSETVHIV